MTVVVRWSSIPEALAMARTDTDMAELIGRRIREARLAAGLTMEGLAEHLSVEPVTVSRWEIGQRTPGNVTLLAKIAQVCGVEPGVLLAEGPPPRPAVDDSTAEILALVGQLGQARRETAIRVLRALVDEG